MNNLRSFGEYHTAPINEGFFSSSPNKNALTSKEKSIGKTERTIHRGQLMQKRKEILGKISKIKTDLDTTNVPVASPVTVNQPVAEMQTQLESLRKKLRNVNKMLS